MNEPYERFILPSTLSEAELVRINRLMQGCKALADQLMHELSDSRYRALALTALEEVSHWAEKGVRSGA